MNEQRPFKFLLELVADLTRLRELFGADWLSVLRTIEPLIAQAANERDPMRLVARVNQLYRVFRGTPAQARVTDLYRGTMALGADERSRRDGTPEAAVLVHASPVETQVLEAAAHEMHREILDLTLRVGESAQILNTGSDPSPAQSADDAQRTGFHFLLQGPGVRGNTLAEGALAKLVFDDGVAPQGALLVESDGLDGAREHNLDIVLVATARGPLQFQGPQLRRATFVEGKLQAPVVFDVLASGQGHAALMVEFLVRGESVHQSEIPVEVVAADAAAPRALGGRLAVDGAPPVGLATLLKSPRPVPAQEIALSLAFSSGRLRIGLTDLRQGELEFTEEYQSDSMDAARLEALLKSVHNDMRGAYQDIDFWSRFDGKSELDAPAIAELGRCLGVIAAAGSRLNAGLREDARIAQALEYVEVNASEGAVLSVSTDDIFLPWELLFPEHRTLTSAQDDPQAGPVHWQRFWGARFAIETNKRGIGSMTALRERHLKAAPKVTVNLNPNIKIKGVPDAGQPLAVQRAWAAQFAARDMLDGVQSSCAEVRPVLLGGTKDVSMIYVYCHGAAPNALGGVAELVRLDDGCDVEPRDFKAKPPYRSAPIVFLNACMAGVSSPLLYSSFLKELRVREALGLIAPTYSVPIVFGAHFGLDVIESYVSRPGSLATAFLELRRRHLQRCGNPVPLLYTLQCHLDAPSPTNMESAHE